MAGLRATDPSAMPDPTFEAASPRSEKAPSMSLRVWPFSSSVWKK